MSSSFCLVFTVVCAGVLPFACSKEVPTPEPATSAAVASLEPAKEEPSSAPETVAVAEPSASAPSGSSTAAAAEAPASGAAKAPSGGKTPGSTPPTPPNTPPPNTPPPAAGYTGPDPCRATSFKFASVRNACNQGGVKQAKSLMKGMVKRAKEDGKEDMKCSTCHDNTKTYTLKPNAVDDMRALQ